MTLPPQTSVIIADFLRPRYRADLRRYAAFLADAPFVFEIAPVDRADDDGPTLSAVYEDRHFGTMPYRTALRFDLAGRREELVTSLFEASHILLLLADQPAWRDRVLAADPTAADDVVVAYFGIDAATSCRASVKAWAEGDFLAPHEDGYACFIVDTRGEVTIRSWSVDLLPVALHLAAGREAERVRLASRVAQVQP